MKLKQKIKFSLLGLALFISSLPISAEFMNIAQSPQGNISSQVWSSAVTSYMSQCSDGDCPCVLVVAEGISGQNTSANMWIGTFKGGMPTELWSGYGSRLANSGQNDENVSMDTDLCKRRNGVATVSGNTACIPGRSCRDVSVYRNLADQLGLPDDVALTSFYFSTPMQEEVYKFHDFYECSSPPCPSTLGCLGLERFAMKSLCLNYMGSDGSNGINAPERGGAWLYFHNTGQPSQNMGSSAMAEQGYDRFSQAGLCSNVSSVHLSSGEMASATDVGGSSSGNDNQSGSGSGGNSGQLISQASNLINETLQKNIESEQALIEEHKSQQEEIEAAAKAVIQSCQQTTVEACPNADESAISRYCDDPEGVARSGCKFGDEA